MNKEYKDMTFDELVSEAAMRIHLGLLSGGGKGFRSEVYQALRMAIEWREEMNKQAAVPRRMEYR